jgi:integrase
MARKLTDRFIESAPAGDHWDSLVVGLMLRVGARSKVWRVGYRIDGAQKYLNLGRYPAVKLADAREAARKALGKVAERQDPKRQPTEVLPDNARETLRACVADYLKLHVDAKLKLSTRRAYRTRLNRLTALLGDKIITRVTRRDLLDFIEGIAAAGHGPEAAHVQRIVVGLFNWLVSRAILPVSPLAGAKPPAKATDRDRVLTDAELRTVWTAAGRVPYPWGPYVRILALVGQRASEVARMRWDQIDNGVWHLPDTKRGSPHLVTLPAQALAILEAEDFPKFEGFIFSTDGGLTPMSPGSNLKAEADPTRTRAKKASAKRGHKPGKLDVAIAELVAEDSTLTLPAPWRLHDLRRGVASGLARLRIAPHVIEATLNHKSGQVRGVARVYNRYAYEAEIADALALWARHIESLVTAAPTNVVAIRAN